MEQIGNSNLRFIKAKDEDRVEIFYYAHNYDRGNYQNSYRSNSRDRRDQFSGRSRGRPRY